MALASRVNTHRQCSLVGHHWVAAGGRACPRGNSDCSQTVYECACGCVDHGEQGGPAWAECSQCRESSAETAASPQQPQETPLAE